MGLRDILKKKDRIEDSKDNRRQDAVKSLQAPEFTFIRSDTRTQEIIQPPSDGDSIDEGHEDANYLSPHSAQPSPTAASRRRSLSDAFRSNGPSRVSSVPSRNSSLTIGASPARRISQRLRLSRAPASSENVPADLPEIITTTGDLAADNGGNTASQWEKRATLLAKTANENEALHRSAPPSPNPALQQSQTMRIVDDGNSRLSTQKGVASTPTIDADIQQAIKLHEEGDLERSTKLFGDLADPKGPNNPLSQVLYGLALRHGWGCDPNPEQAVFFLQAAANNAADVESLALQAGLKDGGAAKGELVLAIFELANCFRNGWGIQKDPLAAKQYYETAANLGDTDAMNEVGWCYLEGFGCKKDKYASAKYYRLAEKNGNKTLGNSWIWKDKYDPEKGKKGKK
ncbi:unnamed protein product [Discula destructiva]